MARPTQLEGRLLAVLDPARRRGPVSRRLGRLLLVAMLLLAAAVAIVRPQAQARAEAVTGEPSARRDRPQAAAESETTAASEETATDSTKDPAAKAANDEIRVNTQAETGTLTGRVLDAEGGPVAGADVRLQQYEAAGARARGTTDESGSYRFEGVPAGHYVLVASALGMARSFRLTPVEGGELSLDVVLRKPVVPVIELRSEDGRPVAGARVRELRQRGDNGGFFLRRVDWDTFGVSISPSDAQGRLRLPQLPEGTIFTATIDHHRQAPVRVSDVTAAEGTVARATMPKGVPLTLRIQPAEDGSLVTDLSLKLFHLPFDHPSTIRGDRVAFDRDGTATLVIEAGQYDMLKLEHEDFFVTPRVGRRGGEFPHIAKGQNDELSFRLHRKVQVRGRVIDASTRRPLAGMDVRGDIANAPSEAAIGGNEWSHAGWGATDENGEYTVSLAAGRARVEFASHEYIAARDKLELDVAPDGSAVAPDFEVRPLPAITGRVLDTAGHPVAGAIVRFRGRWLAVIQPVVTDERGRFELQPPRIPVDLETETRLPEQPIVAFHPYEPLSAAMRVRLDDADASLEHHAQA